MVLCILWRLLSTWMNISELKMLWSVWDASEEERSRKAVNLQPSLVWLKTAISSRTSSRCFTATEDLLKHTGSLSSPHRQRVPRKTIGSSVDLPRETTCLCSPELRVSSELHPGPSVMMLLKAQKCTYANIYTLNTPYPSELLESIWVMGDKNQLAGQCEFSRQLNSSVVKW